MSKSSLARIDKDVQMIKSRLNVEKKFKDGSITSGTCAQVNVNSAGYYTSTLTPLISLGTGENDRIGGSLKLTGLHVQLQLQGQAQAYQARRFKCCIISSTDTSVTNAINDLWDVNPLTGNVDYYSNRNYSNQPRAHKILRTVYIRTPQKQIIATTPDVAPSMVKKFGVKMQQITRFEGSSNTPKDMNYFLVMFADNGNSHPSTTSSNSGVLCPIANSGTEVQEYFRWWYVDN
ncbi:hypothetical protein [Rheinheimera sp.]|uniref:hypothetical protein n=1 Tax=Rheinheimera sp. TaxID=1869214 RepID=UPI0040474CC2